MLDFHLPALSDPVAYTDQDLDHSSGNDYNTDRFSFLSSYCPWKRDGIKFFFTCFCTPHRISRTKIQLHK